LFDDEFATAEAVNALVSNVDQRDTQGLVGDAVARAVDWALDRSQMLSVVGGRRPPVFALAQVLRVLVWAPRYDPCREAKARAAVCACVARLVDAQQQDGSWLGSACLRVPRPDALVPDAELQWTLWKGASAMTLSIDGVLDETFTNFSRDHFGIYTTATVLRALDQVCQREHNEMAVTP
jgi:hypothetical protein